MESTDSIVWMNLDEYQHFQESDLNHQDSMYFEPNKPTISMSCTTSHQSILHYWYNPDNFQ